MKKKLQMLNPQNPWLKTNILDSCDRIITIDDIWLFMRRNNISDIHWDKDVSKNTLTVSWFKIKD